MKPSFRGRGIFISMNKYRGKSMKKKTKTITVGIIISVFLIGIVSAGLIDYFGRITGSVSVEAPVFYASDGHPLEGSEYSLGINEFTPRDSVSFIGAESPKLFVSKPLEIDSFYAANYEMSIHAESNNENGQIDAELWVIQGDNPNNKKDLICWGSTSEPVYKEKTYTISCSGEELSLDETDRLLWILDDGVNSIEYTIYIDGNTKIEVTPQ